MEFNKSLINNGFIPFIFPLPSYSLRKELWNSCLKDHKMNREVDPSVLASKFRFSGGQIRDAAFTARSFSGERNPASPVLSMEDLYKGCKVQSNQKLSSLALKANPHYRWEDIVLPEDTLESFKRSFRIYQIQRKSAFRMGF